MPAPILASPLILPGVVGVAASKKAENKRRQAAANEFSRKYPLSDDYSAMVSTLEAAKAELQNIKKSTANNAGEKRVKSRNTLMLTKWIDVINGHVKDLKVGVNIASTNAPSPALPSQQVSYSPTRGAAERVKEETSEPVVGATEGKQTTEAAPKGKPNWMMIGGVALGIFVVYKLLKK